MKTKFHAASEPIKKLRIIHQYFDGTPIKAILAGGALRDDYMGKADEITDYDYFITDLTPICEKQNVSTDEAIELLIKQAFPNADDLVELFDSAYLTPEEEIVLTTSGSHAQINTVWEIEEGDNTFQLIFTKNDPVFHVNKYFDIGFCKTYCDGKKIRYTDDFLRDVKNKTMTIVGEDMTKEQVEYAIYRHADRLFWKYDNYRIVVPQKYQHFVQDCGFPTF